MRFRSSWFAAICGLIFRACLCTPLFAQVSVTSTSTPVEQNFDGLATTFGTTNTTVSQTWTDNTSIPGWYASVTGILVHDGSVNNGALYSHGQEGNTNRTLASQASGSTGTIRYAVRLQNNTGVEIMNVRVQYTGRQWRNGGNTASQSLAFDFQVGATSITAGTWTAVAGLGFVSPVTGASATALVGTTSPNFTAIDLTIPVTIPIGGEIWLRWTDINDAGGDHGLGIDDVAITFLTSAGGPMVASSTPSLTNFGTSAGTASPSQTLVVSGTDLTTDLTVTAPANYEVAPNLLGPYSNSLSFTPVSGSVSRTVYARIAASAGVGTPTGSLAIASTGAITVNVSLSGRVVAAGILGQYEFPGTPGTGAITLSIPGAQFAAFSRTGVIANAGADVFNSTNWSAIATRDNGTFIEFSVTPAFGYQLTLTELTYSHQRSGTGPTSYQIAYSTDGFATETNDVDQNSSATLVSRTWDFADFTSTSAVTFRIFGWGSTGGTFRVDDVILSGTGLFSLALPVSLLHFDVRRSMAGVELHWATATETNNREFWIQRAVPGQAWQTIGTVLGGGTRNTRADYDFRDATAPAAARLLYRLVQVDNDGAIHLSPIVEVQPDGVPQATDWVALPNPSADALQLVFRGARVDSQTPCRYQVLTSSGTQLAQGQVALDAVSAAVERSLRGVNAGVYLVRLAWGGQAQVLRIVRQN